MITLDIYSRSNNGASVMYCSESFEVSFVCSARNLVVVGEVEGVGSLSAFLSVILRVRSAPLSAQV